MNAKGTLNKVILIGRVGTDPSLSYVKSGAPVLKFTVATSDEGRDGKEITDWHKIVMWGKRAEEVSQLISKGCLVLIEGQIKTRGWDDNGVKKYVTEINTFDVQIIDGTGGGESQNPNNQQNQNNTYQKSGGKQGGYGAKNNRSEIPF